MRLPGARLLALARLVVDASSLSRIVEPAIADLQHEWRASDDFPFRTRVGICGRAYMAALFVVGRHLLVGAARASVTPPPWAIVRQVIVPSMVMLNVAIVMRLFLQTPRGSDDAWLRETVNWVSFQIAWFPLLWPALLDRRTLEWARLPAVRASDIARLTAVWCVLCAAWAGAIGPILRRQPVVAVGESMHSAAIVMGIAAVAGMLAWIALRERRGTLPQPTFFAHFARGIVLAVAALAIGTACEPVVGRIASEWIGVTTAAAGAALILLALRMAERSPGDRVERDA